MMMRALLGFSLTQFAFCYHHLDFFAEIPGVLSFLKEKSCLDKSLTPILTNILVPIFLDY